MEKRVGLIRYLAIGLLLTSIFVQGAEPSWQVKPSVCVNEKAGVVCQFEIQVFTENLPSGIYCLYLQQQKPRCLKQNQFPVTLAVKLSASSELILKNQQGQELLTQRLSVKSLTINHQRRRLRSPWSLF